MTTYIWIDSRQRDIVAYPNPNNFSVTNEQTNDWYINPRTIDLVSSPLEYQKDEFLCSTYLDDIWILYPLLIPISPFIFIELYNPLNNDSNLIYNMQGLKNLKYEATSKHNIVGQWVNYKCITKQVTRIKRRGTFVVKIFDNTGNTLLELEVVNIILSITPYFNDGDYENSLTQARVTN